MTRILVIIAFAAFVPAFAADAVNPTDTPHGTVAQSSREAEVRGKLAELRAKLKAKLEAMTPEEREAWKAECERQRKESIEKRRHADQCTIAERLEAAKAACPDCYRVVEVDGEFVGMTKERYDEHMAHKAKAKPARKLGKRPARLRRQRPRPSGKTRININGRSDR